MSKKTKKKARHQATHNPAYWTREDYHHELFQGRHWKQGWAKILREHPYCGAYIPQMTLHRHIHSKVHDVPVPDGKLCRMAVEKLNTMLANGEISTSDKIAVKLQVLIGIFSESSPATAAMLNYQLEIVNDFYAGQ